MIELDRATWEPFSVFEKTRENMMDLKRTDAPFDDLENDAIKGFWILCRGVPEATGSKERRSFLQSLEARRIRQTVRFVT